MIFKKGDIVRLKEPITVTDFRVGDTPIKDSVWVTCKISGHRFSGYLPADQIEIVKFMNL